jgi:hypothetical protein
MSHTTDTARVCEIVDALMRLQAAFKAVDLELSETVIAGQAARTRLQAVIEKGFPSLRDPVFKTGGVTTLAGIPLAFKERG